MLAYILLKLQNILQQFERRLNEWIMNVCRQDRLKYKKAKRAPSTSNEKRMSMKRKISTARAGGRKSGEDRENARIQNC